MKQYLPWQLACSAHKLYIWCNNSVPGDRKAYYYYYYYSHRGNSNNENTTIVIITTYHDCSYYYHTIVNIRKAQGLTIVFLLPLQSTLSDITNRSCTNIRYRSDPIHLLFALFYTTRIENGYLGFNAPKIVVRTDSQWRNTPSAIYLCAHN